MLFLNRLGSGRPVIPRRVTSWIPVVMLVSTILAPRVGWNVACAALVAACAGNPPVDVTLPAREVAPGAPVVRVGPVRDVRAFIRFARDGWDMSLGTSKLSTDTETSYTQYFTVFPGDWQTFIRSEYTTLPEVRQALGLFKHATVFL